MLQRIVQSWKMNPAINDIGYTRYQLMFFLFAGLGWFIDNMVVQGLAICLPFLRCEFEKSEQQVREATVSLSVGLIVGAIFWSNSSDRLGPRPAYLCTMPSAAVCVFVGAFMPYWHALCTCLALA